MDDKDKKIIECLKENAKLSTQQIAKKTLISVTTVHNRIKKMVETGVIKKYTVVIDEEKLGKHIPACILINGDKEALAKKNLSYNDLTERLKKMPEVYESLAITGVFEFLIKVKVESVAKLNKFLVRLWKIEGVEKTQTCLILYEAN